MAPLVAWVGANLSTIATVASIGGTVLSAVGQYRQGQAVEAAAGYNAQVTEREAAQNEQASRDRLRRLMATQRALYAKAGVDITSGSPLLVLAEQASEREKEALNIRYGGEESAAIQRFEGKQARIAGTIGAGSTLLTGLGRTGVNFYKKK